MTKGFYTVIQFPCEGSVIKEHQSKKEAEDAYRIDCAYVEKEDFLGAALVRMEVIAEKGNWK